MADLVISPANVAPGDGAIRQVGTADEAIQAGEVVYRDPASGRWLKASHDAVDVAARIPEALALNAAAAGQPLSALTDGPLMLGAVLAPGSTYYLSDTEGKICLASDIAADEFVSIVGMAKTNIVLDVKFLSAYVRDKGETAPSHIMTNTTMRDSYVMLDSLRMTDYG